MNDVLSLHSGIYMLPLLVIWLTYLRFNAKKTKKSLAVKQQAIASGLIEPASLHPTIDPAKCIGCGSCVNACPEGENQVLGIVYGRAELLNPTHCIGHGACKASCPVDAITLVFGTERRGVDIPNVKPDFETNVAGIYIAGELGGMGLIRNAVEQGKQAMDSIVKKTKNSTADYLDVVVVGAGPAGISASLAAKEKGLSFVTLEQDTLGGTVAHFPRGKVVMTAPVTLPLFGKVNFKETTKEALLELWQQVIRKSELQIEFNQRVESIEKTAHGFKVSTNDGVHHSYAVLLTIGRRGTPRKLGVEGEHLNKVVYRLIDPAQYQGQHVLVVGGGDSALEAAISIAEQPDTVVSVSYRSASFSRAKQKNRQRIVDLESAGQISVLFESEVQTITQDSVILVSRQQDRLTIPNDAVIVCAGGILPTPFLKSIGVDVETKYGRA